jgi:hypothetical protein
MRPGCARAAPTFLQPSFTQGARPLPIGEDSAIVSVLREEGLRVCELRIQIMPSACEDHDARHRRVTVLTRPAFADPRAPRACRLKSCGKRVRSNRRACSMPLSGCRFATIEIQDVPASQTFFSMID